MGIVYRLFTIYIKSTCKIIIVEAKILACIKMPLYFRIISNDGCAAHSYFFVAIFANIVKLTIIQTGIKKVLMI